MRTARSVLWAFVATAFACGAPAAAAKPPDIDATRLEKRVTVEGVLEHQQALQEIADANGGTRYTRTPGYTASAAYVKETLEAAGYDARYEMFNMPIWHESAPPVLQRLTPSAKTYVPGTSEDDGAPDVDFITFEHSPTADGHGAGGAGERHRDTEPGRLDRRLRGRGLPGGDRRRDRAHPARHLRVHAEARAGA